MNSRESGYIDVFPEKMGFVSKLTNTTQIDDEAYENTKKLWNVLKIKNLSELYLFYNMCDGIQMGECFEEFFDQLYETTKINPRLSSSISILSKNYAYKKSRVILTGPQCVQLASDIENSIRGGYADAPHRVVFDTRIFKDLEGSDLPVYAKIKSRKEGRGYSTDKNSAFEEKRIYSTGLLIDQVSQYATAMTRKIVTGQFLKMPNKPPHPFKTISDWIINTDFVNGDYNYFIVCTLNPPSDFTTPEGMCVEQLNCLLHRKKVKSNELSPIQILRKREKSNAKLSKEIQLEINQKAMIGKESHIKQTTKKLNLVIRLFLLLVKFVEGITLIF